MIRFTTRDIVNVTIMLMRTHHPAEDDEDEQIVLAQHDRQASINDDLSKIVWAGHQLKGTSSGNAVVAFFLPLTT